MTTVILVLILITEISKAYTEFKTFKRNEAVLGRSVDTLTYENKLLRERNKNLEEDVKILSRAVNYKISDKGFIITGTGIKALPKNWENLIDEAMTK